ncbi:DUF2059 domain-containing protein [uncultured Microbulbifer sp.]|uniref:DUF2059 domain-containing protein n=1 Tax=uncultured Microbulbifer sp. TaxID=348147 RepID=UPI0025DF1699|nr:DUF2059 domain-containing protein [uncultured Microbulbifer sp.]
MKRYALALIATLLCPLALAATPSKESIRELMTITDMPRMLENSMAQVDSMMQTTMQQALAGEDISEADQKVLQEMQDDMVALLKEEMSWAQLEPIFTQIYSESLSQSEVDGMLEFYKSDAGKAVIAKMPVIMQNSMQLMQQKMGSMMPKIKEIQQAAITKIKANKEG